MATIRDYRTAYRNVVKIMSASLVGVPFKFEYRPMGVGGEAFIASYDGEKMVNCAFGTTEDGAEDKSVIIVPINYIKIAPAGGAYVRRTFRGDIVETELILPNDGGEYKSFAGYTAGGSIDDVEGLKNELREMLGNDPDSESAKTPAIDNQKEVSDFLEGFENTDKLKDILDSQNQPLSEEQMRELQGLFPTE